MFTTWVDKQTGIDVHVLQGEREMADDCRSLAKFTLKGIPPQPAGLPRIEVKFLIDANGILTVSAEDVRTGQQQSIEVKPSYGLSDEQIEKMLMDSMEFAEEDLRIRGPGEVLGIRQAGMPVFCYADLRRDAEILYQAREIARDLLAEDPLLEKPENRALRQAFTERWQGRLQLSRIG